MPDDPYRPDPEHPHAAAHKHRHAVAPEAKAERKRETRIRQSLGAYRGSPSRKLSLALFVLAVLSASGFVGSLGALGTELLVPCIVLFILGLIGGLLFASVKALATPATVAAEKTWLAALPFAIDNYFDLLGAEPVRTCVLVAEFEWAPSSRGNPPDNGVVHGIAGLWDAGARVTPQNGHVELRSSWLNTGSWDSGVVETVDSFGKISPDKGIPKAVHRLVDKVLLPLHKSHAIARVKLSRTDERNDRY